MAEFEFTASRRDVDRMSGIAFEVLTDRGRPEPASYCPDCPGGGRFCPRCLSIAQAVAEWHSRHTDPPKPADCVGKKVRIWSAERPGGISWVGVVLAYTEEPSFLLRSAGDRVMVPVTGRIEVLDE